MGDTVNLAARLMAAAPEGAIYAAPAVLDQSRTLYATETLEPFHVKGKTEPVQAYAVGEETGDRSVEVGTNLPFIGREKELVEIRAAVEAWQSGAGGVVTIVGDTGSGKSRLAREAVPGETDAEMMALRAEPYGAASPYRPFRDPVRRLLGIERGPQDDMVLKLIAGVERIDPSLLPLAPLLGDLAHVDAPATPESGSIEPRFRRDRLADLFISLLERLDADRLLITVEDAHWMDEASDHLLSKLAAATESRPWLLMSTRRESDGGFDPSTGRRLELAPLGPDQARELVIAATTATPLRPHDVEVIVQRAGGNPFFLGEVLRIVRESGSTEALPDSLGSMVSTEIDALAPLPRRVLRYCSVLGRSFRTAVVREILTQAGLVLDAATRSALSEFVVGDGPGRLRFRHAMVRDVAYEGLSFRRRQALHLQAGEVIEDMAGDDPEGVAGILSMHFSIGRDPARAWQYGRIAGDRAREAYANEEAAVQYERALEAARRLEECPPQDLRTVWTRLGDVREQAGRFDAALEAYRRASQLTGDDVVARAELHLKRASTRVREGSYPAALREATRARHLVEPLDSRDAARQHARVWAFSGTVYQRQERPHHALAAAAGAIDEARTSGEQAAHARALSVTAWAHLMLDKPGAEALFRQALELYEDVGDLPGQADVSNNLGGLAYFEGRWNEALDYYERSRTVMARVGNVPDVGLVEANIGEVLVNQGRLGEAEPVLRSASRGLRASGYVFGATFAEMQLGRLLTTRGDLDDAEQLLTVLQHQVRELGYSRDAFEVALYLADCLVQRGEPARALSLLDDAGEEAGDEASIFLPTEARVRAAAMMQLGRRDQAEGLVTDGLAAARQRGLKYDAALHLELQARIRDGQDPSSATDARNEAREICDRLGVRTPSPVEP